MCTIVCKYSTHYLEEKAMSHLRWDSNLCPQLHIYMKISTNHNSLGCKQPSDLDVKQSPNVQDTFRPKPVHIISSMFHYPLYCTHESFNYPYVRIFYTSRYALYKLYINHNMTLIISRLRLFPAFTHYSNVFVHVWVVTLVHSCTRSPSLHTCAYALCVKS